MNCSLLAPFSGRSPALAPPTLGLWRQGYTKGARVACPLSDLYRLTLKADIGSDLAQITADSQDHITIFPVNRADLLAAVREVCGD